MKTTKKTNRIITTCLVYLLVVVSVMVPATLSGYISTANGQDDVQVAVFDVKVDQNANNKTDVELKIGDSASVSTYAFTVTNTSDVTISYSVEIIGLPTGVDVSGNSSPYILAIGASQNHELKFTATENATETSQAQNVQIRIVAVQVD